MLPLFKHYPRLAERLPHITLGQLPTPVEHLGALGEALGVGQLYIKRDDLSGAVYGGNKVRKLEFLLAAAVRSGASEVMTVGFAGSNHALATAIYANGLGLASISMLMPQANAHYVRRNLLAGHHYHARFRYCRNLATLSMSMLPEILASRVRQGAFPYIIPGGGTCPLGVTGYVNAAFELRDQIQAGLLPTPDLIYVAMGSMGTSAGLMLGLRAAGVKSRVVPIRVIGERLASPAAMRRLLHRTGAFLRRHDPEFPAGDFRTTDLGIRDDLLGDGYARFSDRGLEAAARMRQHAGINLNGTYTAKAFSAILADAATHAVHNKVVLFWNTYNSRDLAKQAGGVDYRQLPRALHHYFEQKVQPLDLAGADR